MPLVVMVLLHVFGQCYYKSCKCKVYCLNTWDIILTSPMKQSSPAQVVWI